jgi:hypothetical protein
MYNNEFIKRSFSIIFSVVAPCVAVKTSKLTRGKFILTLMYRCEIWGFHGSEDDDDDVLGLAPCRLVGRCRRFGETYNNVNLRGALP